MAKLITSGNFEAKKSTSFRTMVSQKTFNDKNAVILEPHFYNHSIKINYRMSTLAGYDQKLSADVTFRSANKELLRVNSAGLRSTNESGGRFFHAYL